MTRGLAARIVLAVAAGSVVAFVVSWFSSATLGIALGVGVAAVLGGPAVRRSGDRRGE